MAWPHNDLKKIKDMESVEACRDQCKQVEGATRFTWRGPESKPKRNRKSCFCKNLGGALETVIRRPESDVYSGLTEC